MSPIRPRLWTSADALVALALAALAGCSSPRSAPERTLEAWQELAAADTVPEHLGAELIELAPLFENSDPAVRDELAYGLATEWVLGSPAATPDELRRVLHVWTAGMSVPEQNSHPEAALGCSFSALALALIAARDLRTPFLHRAEHDELLSAALTYLAEERDERGFDETVGWVHAPAHTADLLKYLGASALLTSAGQAQILSGLAQRARRPNAAPFEDGRARGSRKRWGRSCCATTRKRPWQRSSWTRSSRRPRPRSMRPQTPWRWQRCWRRCSRRRPLRRLRSRRLGSASASEARLLSRRRRGQSRTAATRSF